MFFVEGENISLLLFFFFIDIDEGFVVLDLMSVLVDFVIVYGLSFIDFFVDILDFVFVICYLKFVCIVELVECFDE